ncbi:MAG: apolipoprotein N-acyltransferase, partial [Tepidisphaeraceae bacterium]
VLYRGLGLLWVGRGVAKPQAGGEEWGWSPLVQVLLVAVLWVGLEWVRGNYSMLGPEGLPWLYMGYTQSPALVMCQMADLIGVSGVSFWVVLVNALIALWVLERFSFRRLHSVLACIAVVLGAVLGYGIFRMSQNATYPGPRVMVVQPNYIQDNTGQKGATQREINDFHFETTRKALEAEAAQGRQVDLVVWSETMMPAVNPRTRDFFGARGIFYFDEMHEALRNLAYDFRTALLVGGAFGDRWIVVDGDAVPKEKRNSAYFFNAAGLDTGVRYDKVHLVPFGEFIPFQNSWPWLYRQLINLGPPNMEDYQLTRGDADALTVFTLEKHMPTTTFSTTQAAHMSDRSAWRFVTPICFEDVDPRICSRMFRPESGGGRNKRADFLVNITNDGWFRANEMPQHLQAAVFRSIENRAPTARSVNTGISGFIDSVGRTHDLVPASTEGWNVATLTLDTRLSLFTRAGDIFAAACSVVTGAAVVAVIGATARARQLRRRQAEAGNGR